MKLSTVLLTAFALNVDAGKGNRRKQSRQANSGTFTIFGQIYLRTRSVQSFRRPWPQTSELIVKLQKLNVIKKLNTLEQRAQPSWG